MIFDLPGRESLQRVPTIEPLRGTRAHVGALLDADPTANELLAALRLVLRRRVPRRRVPEAPGS